MTDKYTNRKRVTTTIEKELICLLDELHSKTRIPRSRLYDEAISDLLDKYQIERKKD